MKHILRINKEAFHSATYLNCVLDANLQVDVAANRSQMSLFIEVIGFKKVAFEWKSQNPKGCARIEIVDPKTVAFE